MIIGITGTPGTGKTAVTNRLQGKNGYQVIHLNELIREEKLYCEVDTERDCVVADMDKVEKWVLRMVDPTFIATVIDSHLSHHVADHVIVLRTSPTVLRERLEKRGYSAAKIEENLEAEALDIILAEAVEWCDNVFEINTTDIPVEETVDSIEEIIHGLIRNNTGELTQKYRPGSVEWSEEFFS